MAWRAVAALVLAAGCGGGGHAADGGRDASSEEVPVVGRTDGPAEAAPSDARDAGLDAWADALAAVDGASGDGVDEAAPASDAEAGADAPDDALDAAVESDAATPDVAVWVPRDASHEVAPPHDTRPKYLGTYAPATNTGTATVAVVASDGATYLAGAFQQSTDFDPGPGKDVRQPEGVADGFVTKLAPDGSYLWTVTFGGKDAPPGSDGAAGSGGTGRSLSQVAPAALALSGNSLVVAGAFTGTVDFDPGAGVHNVSPDAFFGLSGFALRLTPDGSFVWVSAFMGTSICQANGVALDDDGSVYVAGAFRALCDLDPGDGQDFHNSDTNSNGYLVKLGADDGHEVWARSFDGGTCTAQLNAVTTSSDGRVWATGQLDDDCSLEGQTAPAGTTTNTGVAGGAGPLGVGGAAAIAAFTPDGAPSGLWSILGGSGTAIVGSPDGFVYVGGSISDVNTADFDPGPAVASQTISPSSGDPTGFVLKLGPGAAFQWVQTTSRIATIALAATDDGGAVVLGQPVPDAQQTIAFTVVKRDPDSSSPWGVVLPGTSSMPTGISAGSASFVVAGFTSAAMDLDPGSGVDDAPGAASFASRYSF